MWWSLALAQDRPVACELAVPLHPDEALQTRVDGATGRLAVELEPGVYTLTADISHLDALVLCGATPGVVLTSDDPLGMIRGSIADLTLHQLVFSLTDGPAADVVLEPGFGATLSHVTVSAAGFGSAVRIEGTGEVRVNDSLFSGGMAFAGAHLALGGTVTATVQDSSFLSGIATARGGAIYGAPETSLTVVDSDFVANRGSSGGAVAALGTLAVFGGVFEDNVADCQGACGLNEGRGGAILAQGLDITLEGLAQFENNEAASDGGALAVNAGGVTSIRDLTLCSNSADGRGGGLFLTGSDTVPMGALRIIENRASVGGGIFGNVALSRSNLLGNQAAEVGAALAGRSAEGASVGDSIAAWNTGANWVDSSTTDVRGRMALWNNAGPRPDAMTGDDEPVDGERPPAFRAYEPGRGACDAPADYVSVVSSALVGSQGNAVDPDGWGSCPGEPGALCQPNGTLYGAYGPYGLPGEEATTSYTFAWVDQDGDGWPAIFDCADTDPSEDPEVSFDRLDGFDNDCDAVVDLDFDGDGWLPPLDCDDENPLIHPEAERTEELGRFVDHDCDDVFEDPAASYNAAPWGTGCASARGPWGGSLLSLFLRRSSD